MKALRVLLPIVLAGLLVVFGVSGLTRRSTAASYALEREGLRREFVERAGVARGLPGPAGIEEGRAVLRWWFDGLASLGKRYPGAHEAPRTGREKKDKVDAAAAAEWQKYADERLDVLRESYAPVLGAVDQGVRLDLLHVEAAEHPETHERGLRIDFALWGAPRRLESEGAAEASSRERPTLHVVVPLAFRQLAFHFVNEAGKPYGEMTGSGEPYRALKDPDRFSADLPPGVVLGTWWVEPFPREAARVEIVATAQVQGMTGGALTPTFRWEVPVLEAWKLLPGETFRADVRELPPSEPAER